MPGPVADERQGLLAFLAHQRYCLKVCAHGLSDEQARATPSASALSVGGLLKHAALTERDWVDTMLQRPSRSSPEDYVDGFRMRADETLADLLERYESVAAETATAVDGVADLGQAVPVPRGVPWFPADVEAWSVRWVLLHLIEETARHAGHADIVRESVDGAQAYPLMAAAEGWAPTPWVTPWQPALARQGGAS